MKYRSEIDGLRAIAVLGVVGYHANLPGFTAGFLGVDIFFVISGYLITSILLKDVRPIGQVLSSFYLRRILRLLPALLIVLAATTAIASFVLLPNDFGEYGLSLIGATLFFANFVFWERSGYFESEVALNPLLHTWSLAIEEQFYILFPLLFMLLIRRCAWIVVPVTVGVIFVSIVAAELTSSFVPFGSRHTFFLLPFRVWELLLGTMVALMSEGRRLVGTSDKHCALAALIIIVGVLLFWKADGNTPDLPYYIVCFATAAVILLGNVSGSLVHRILSNPSMVFLGKISYPLYLWHWPIISFFIYASMRPPTVAEGLTIIAISIMLATLTWRYIELPLRATGENNSTVALTWWRNAIFTVIGGLLFVGTGSAIYTAPLGSLQRLDPDVETASLAELDVVAELDSCLNGVLQVDAPVGGNCRFKLRENLLENEPPMLLLGDSQATDLLPAVKVVAEERGHELEVYARMACPPYLQELFAGSRRRNAQCNSFLSNLTPAILASEYSVVVIGARWYGSTFGDERRRDLSDGSLKESSLFKHMELTLDTLEAVAGRVVIVLPRPEARQAVPGCVGRARRFAHDVKQCAPLRGLGSDAWYQNTVRILYLLAESREFVSFIDPTDILCETDGHCSVGDSDGVWYSDEDHLSVLGASKLVPLFREVISTSEAQER